MPATGKFKKIINRIAYTPLGVIFSFIRAVNEESRHWENRSRFPHASVGRGTSIDADSSISTNAAISSETTVNRSAIGAYSYIGKSCLIQSATIGRYCSIANNVTIGPGQHPIEHFSTSPTFYRKKNPSGVYICSGLETFEEYKPIAIGHDVWIGCNAVIQDGVKVGTGAIIAAGAVVTKDVAPYSIVGGVPAKPIKHRFSSEQINKLINSEWWAFEAHQAVEKIKAFGIGPQRDI